MAPAKRKGQICQVFGCNHYRTHPVDPITHDDDDIDDEQLHDEVNKYCDSETMAYVMGSIIHRLACKVCSFALSEVKSKDESEGFMSLMTYETGHLHEPSGPLTSAFRDVMPSFLQHVQSNFHVLHVVDNFVEFLERRAQFASLPFCRNEHKRTALKFFARMILRTFCREKNAAIKASKKRGPQSAAKLRRLNV